MRELTPEQAGMVAWAHYNALVREENFKPETDEYRCKLIANMADQVSARTKDKALISSMEGLIALSLYRLEGYYSKAIDAVTEAISLDPDNADNYIYHGILLKYILGQEAKAQGQFLKAIDCAGRQIKAGDSTRFKYIRSMGDATMYEAIILRKWRYYSYAIAITYQAEALWLTAQEGGWNTKRRRADIAKMRDSWQKDLRQ